MLQWLDEPSEIGIKGNVGAAPIGIINNGAGVYPVGEYGASFWRREFVCNSMSSLWDV